MERIATTRRQPWSELTTKAWTSGSLSGDAVMFRFSAAAAASLRAALTDRRTSDSPAPPVPVLAAEIEDLRDQIEGRVGFALLDPVSGIDDLEQRRAAAWLIGSMLGEPVVQNVAGDRVVSVYDRDRTRRMGDGARYHQTREGGSLHTDNVNLLERWDYLAMTCVAPAMTGGESLLVSGLSVYEMIRREAPQAIEILCADFWWERRGISETLFRAPIISFNRCREPEFRYLRPYLVSAHETAGEPLTEAQLWAIDTLDSVLESSALQFRHKLQSGQTLIINDNQMFHGRTCFSDHFDGITYQPGKDAGDKPFNRFFDRVWITRPAPESSSPC